MRTRIIATGAIVLSSLLLAGCSGSGTATAEKTAAPEASASTSESATTEPTKEAVTDCPTLAVGATIDATVLASCVGDAAMASAGYAMTSSTLGMDITGKINPAAKEVALTMPMGSIVSIGDQAWVQSTGGTWQVADATSSDPTVAALSQATSGLATFDYATSLTGITGTLTVTGEDTLLGEKVYVATGDLAANGVTTTTSYSLTSGWVPLQTTSSATVSGTTVESKTTVTEWDKKQDIQPPL